MAEIAISIEKLTNYKSDFDFEKMQNYALRHNKTIQRKIGFLLDEIGIGTKKLYNKGLLKDNEYPIFSHCCGPVNRVRGSILNFLDGSINHKTLTNDSKADFEQMRLARIPMILFHIEISSDCPQYSSYL